MTALFALERPRAAAADMCGLADRLHPVGAMHAVCLGSRARQDGSTADMIFGVDHLVWYLSQFMTLYPGDIINTGTPAGVALGQRDDIFLRPGDVMELEISGLGTQRQVCSSA
jgi:2-keto-4-pentenoate hydratase/2-oxohepta-3-ene-1,7-dioic acid hydratase in catechol pathway